ncbi:12289_t:CDS:1, partial [Entrophospora sp. SA101]
NENLEISSNYMQDIDIQQDPNQDQQHTNHQEQVNQINRTNEDNCIIQIDHDNQQGQDIEDNCQEQEQYTNHQERNIQKRKWTQYEINILVEFFLDKKINVRKLRRLGLLRTEGAILNRTRIIK